VVNTSSGDATAGNILTGKKAWVDGSEVTGSLTCPSGPTGNAVVGDVLSGKTFSNSGGAGLTGTMTNQGATDYTPGISDQTITAGYYNGSGHVVGDADLSAGNIKAGTEIFSVTGTFPNDGTATTDDVKTDSTFYTDSAVKLTGTGTKTLSSANDTVSAGYYEATTLSAVDADLAAANIKKGADIFGKVGTYEGTGGGSATIAKTGQTTSYATGDDGDLQKGVAWPNPRFTDNSNGTVTDNLTGLIWLQNANAFGTRDWATALTDCNTLNSGEHGLTDGSKEGDWRLPNVKELLSLIDWSQSSPVLPSGHPFTSVQSSGYWSSTTYESNTYYAWYVYMGYGGVGRDNKDGNHSVWPVRSGN